MTRILYPAVASILAILYAGSDVLAQLEVAPLVGDGMVVQREQSIPVWGTATPGAMVTVTLPGNEAAATADESGRWLALLPALEVGGPYTMTIASGDDRVEIADVWSGDVWLASGQSNMEWTITNSLNAEEEIAAADEPMIRHFNVPRSWAWYEEDGLAGGSWEVASPVTVGEFTAVGYHFVRALRRHHDVPMGIVNTTWGGSTIQAWMSATSLGMSEGERSGLAETIARRDQEMADRLRSIMGELPERDEGIVDGVALWAAPDHDDSGWLAITVPAFWEQAGFEGMDGVAWYRTSFSLTQEEASAGATIGLGMIDDSDTAWINGVPVGGIEWAWNQVREYEAPPSALRAGANSLAVRVFDGGGGGGIAGDPETVYVEAAGARRALAGSWKFKPAEVRVNMDSQKHRTPTLLYNKMVHPILRVPIRGAIWYQGESNATPTDAFLYRDMLQAMIADWRTAFNDPDMPFFVVQLPNFMAVKPEPSESDWAILRESQREVLSVENTGLAVTIDVGEAGDIHPRDKKPVGERLAAAARRVVYEEDVVFSGPIYRSHEIVGNRVVVSFDHVGGGLVAEGGPGEFAVAGSDSQFVWAEAQIDGDKIVVWHPEVKNPVAVRYAWADNPEGANVYNQEGFPASPFRTDDW